MAPGKTFPLLTRLSASIITLPPSRSRPTPSTFHGSTQPCHITNALNSRQSLKKYVKANNTINATDNMFDALFNKALKVGVEKGVFEQPKGMQPRTRAASSSCLTINRSLRRHQARQEGC
jgi:hypothetical protein